MPASRKDDASARAGFAALVADGAPVMRLAEGLADRSRTLYVVGGAVRDALMEEPLGSDVDLATDASPDETLEVVRPMAEAVWLQGIRFGTVGARIGGLDLEITTFRSDRYEPDSRHPEVSYEGTIETDLSRRDFTVNALAVRLPDRTMVDLFDGKGDIERRVLRTPVDPDISFSDDPLRILRAFRFASQLAFDIAPETLRSIERLRDKLATISAERIRDELSRLLVGRKPARALKLADSVGVVEMFLPELSALKLEQDPIHKHKDVFSHTLAVMEQAPTDVRHGHPTVRLAALLHDIGKPRTRRYTEEGVSFHHHEVVGARMAETRLRELRYPNEVVAAVRDMIFLHHRFHTYRLGWTDAAVRRYARDAGPLLEDLNNLVRADCTTRNAAKAKALRARMDELEERIAEVAAQEELDKLRPALDGTQIMAFLGVAPGKIVGEARAFLMDLRIDEGELDQDDAYERLDRWARERGIEPVGERVPPKPRKEEEAS